MQENCYKNKQFLGEPIKDKSALGNHLLFLRFSYEPKNILVCWLACLIKGQIFKLMVPQTSSMKLKKDSQAEK